MYGLALLTCFFTAKVHIATCIDSPEPSYVNEAVPFQVKATLQAGAEHRLRAVSAPDNPADLHRTLFINIPTSMIKLRTLLRYSNRVRSTDVDVVGRFE